VPTEALAGVVVGRQRLGVGLVGLIAPSGRRVAGPSA
jgi:hypothetical protein